MARAGPSGAGAALIWGGSGFIVGAIFWHAIGFWDFMTAVVLGDQESRRRQPEASNSWSTQVIVTPTPGRSAARRTVVAGNCISLAIDRSKGETTTKPCPAILPSVPATAAVKADRLAGPLEATPADQTEAVAVGTTPNGPASPNPLETSSIKFTAPWLAETHPAKPN